MVPEAVERQHEYSLVGHYRLRGDILQHPANDNNGKACLVVEDQPLMLSQIWVQGQGQGPGMQIELNQLRLDRSRLPQ
jgi:hypothetical protein